MKKLLLFLTVITLFSIFFSACKKENTTINPPQVGKWMFEKGYNHDYIMGVESRDTVYGTADDYMDFKLNNTIFRHILGDTATLFYQMSGLDKFIWWQPTTIKFTSNILKLTNSEFIIQTYYKDSSDSSDETIFLKR